MMINAHSSNRHIGKIRNEQNETKFDVLKKASFQPKNKWAPNHKSFKASGHLLDIQPSKFHGRVVLCGVFFLKSHFASNFPK